MDQFSIGDPGQFCTSDYNVAPDETTILSFRHLLEQHGLTKRTFDEVQDKGFQNSQARADLRPQAPIDVCII